MIPLTRLGGRPFYLNSDLIESIESRPDTTIHLTNDKLVLVEESVVEVVQRIVAFRRSIFYQPRHRRRTTTGPPPAAAVLGHGQD